MYGLASAINLVANILVILVIAKVLVSYFLDPYHPIRRALDTLVEPFIAPIRNILPNMGMIDFSPMVLILLIEFLARIIINILIR